MEVFLIKALQMLIAISLLILLHEGGHFFFSKLFGVRVEKFYLFFDVTIGKWKGALFKFKPKKSDTEYGIGWLPFGGYCKIAGMVDESFDTEQMKQPEQPWEFRTKPAWQRLLIMIGGVLVNFVLALFIYSMVLFYWGESYVPLEKMTYGMEFNEQAKALGFQDGDVLLGTDKVSFKENVEPLHAIADAKKVYVLRNGQKDSVAITTDLSLLDMTKTEPRFMRMIMPAVIDSVMDGTPAAEVGLQKGDVLTMVNGKAITSYHQFTDEIKHIEKELEEIKTHGDNMELRRITLAYDRNGRCDTISVMLTEQLQLGFMARFPYEATTIEYGFFESFPAGVKYGWNVLASYVSDLKYLFTADGAKSLGGFGTIGNLFPSTWDWHQFWLITALFSIILAFMNILPIPALDGGHVLFLLYEIITRRKPSENFLIRAEYIGFGIIILLMVVANLNDILRAIGIM